MTKPDVLLDTADRLLTGTVPGTRGLWPRTVAFVLRAALEEELAAFWLRVEPEVADAPMRAQLLLLWQFAGTPTSGRATDVWHELSRASHHHAYELAPEANQLRTWLDEVRHVSKALKETA